MSVTNISVLRKNLFSTIDNVIEFNESVTVSTKNGNAVIISEDEYKAMMETIFLVSQKGLVERINLQHRLVYKLHKDINTIIIHSMLSYYGDN